MRTILRKLACLLMLTPILACQQMGAGGMGAAGSPSKDAADEVLNKQSDDLADPLGKGGLGNTNAAAGAAGTGGADGTATADSGSGGTFAKGGGIPLSAPADPSSVECTPESTDPRCIRIKASMALMMGEAISNDPRIDLKSQPIKIVSVTDGAAASLGISSDKEVLNQLLNGALPPEAMTVQDVTVDVQANGTLDLASVLKPGINLVFDTTSTPKDGRYSYIGSTHLSATEFNAIRDLKKLNVNEGR